MSNFSYINMSKFTIIHSDLLLQSYMFKTFTQNNKEKDFLDVYALSLTCFQSDLRYLLNNVLCKDV